MTEQQTVKPRRGPVTRARGAAVTAGALALAASSALAVYPASAAVSQPEHPAASSSPADSDTGTPIKHVVVLYQENHSFDNYFGTYPHAANQPGEPAFSAAPRTPAVNGLSGQLLTSNPNLANPFRLDRSQIATCDNNHNYTPMQQAYDGGKLDQFVQAVSPSDSGCTPNLPMGYYDGNTVTGLWSYAQHFAMSDNTFADTYGPSNPQIFNFLSGQTHGAVPTAPTPAVVNGTLIANLNPEYDDCGHGGSVTLEMTGKNIGDLLDAKNVTWGWFTGGFRPTSVTNGTAACDSAHTSLTGTTHVDYQGGNDPFEYYASTDNPHHLPPTSTATIGHTDQANHQYDLSDFWAAADAGNMPSVSFLRPPSYQHGHPGYSDPLDEQHFIVDTINRLQQLPTWNSTAVLITWDESDGWYDHVMPPLVNDSQSSADVLTGPGTCGTSAPLNGYQDRCGFGPRIPLMLISPYAKGNFVSHSLTAQSAITRFIEDNWGLGHIGSGSFDVMSGSIRPMFNFSRPSDPKLYLDPITGEPVSTPPPAAS